jgi:plastocyanin
MTTDIPSGRSGLVWDAGPWSLDARLRSGSAKSAGRQAAQLAVLLAVGLGAVGCQAARPLAAAYRPQSRAITITTIPLLTREMGKVYPFLTGDFAPGGVLAGQEVYAFMPSTVTVIEGDTIQFRFINPEDDLHWFVLLPDLSVALPGLQTTTATYIARQAGVFTFTCSVPAHLPAMWGQLVVLSPGAIGQAGGVTGSDPASSRRGPGDAGTAHGT